MAGSPHTLTHIFLFKILKMFVFHSSLSPCAAELEVGAKDIKKKKSFVQKSIFYAEFVKNKK